VPEEQFLYPHHWPAYSEAEKDRLLQREREILNEMGNLGSKLNVKIGVENTRPYLDCPGYSYSEIPAKLAEQVKQINHPNVGATLDVGHLYMAVKTYGLDLKREMEVLSPLIIHLHIHDNHGIPCYSWEKNQYELIPRGRGDMHMPIGDCEIPMQEIFVLLDRFEGYWIHEIRERYQYAWPTLRERTERILK
jgi:sugar phosphate isomerase/epimerase